MTNEPLPLASAVVCEATLYSHEEDASRTLAVVQLRATDLEGNDTGFTIPADQVSHLASMLKSAGKKARRNKSLLETGAISAE